MGFQRVIWWRPAIVLVGAAIAIATFALFATTALAAGTVGVDSPTVPANGIVTVTLTAEAPAGKAIGNWIIEIHFNGNDQFADPTCTQIGTVNCQISPGGNTGVVRFSGAVEPPGLSGSQALGTAVFKPHLSAGNCTAITVTIIAFADSEGAPFADPTLSNGQICAPAAATNSPAPTAAPTTSGAATPTKTPGALPSTGGPADDGSSLSLNWLFVAAGLVVAAGGAWTLSRARHDNSR